jgi:hypothetical protein
LLTNIIDFLIAERYECLFGSLPRAATEKVQSLGLEKAYAILVE